MIVTITLILNQPYTRETLWNPIYFGELYMKKDYIRWVSTYPQFDVRGLVSHQLEFDIFIEHNMQGDPPNKHFSKNNLTSI